MSTKIIIRAKAFSGEGVRSHRAMIEDGRVLVWDDVAGHYASCHALSATTQARIIRTHS